MKRFSLPFVLLLMAGMSGCVTKADHMALQGELDATKQKLLGSEERAGQLETDIQEQNQTIRELEEKIAAAKAEVVQLETLIAAAEGDLAALIKDRSRLKASIQDMSEALAVQRGRRAEAERRIDEYRDMLARFKGLIEAGKLNVKIVDGRMVLALPMDILFDSGQAKLSDEGAKALLEVGQELAKIADKEFQIEGHTDNVPIYNEKFHSNWELASARALVVLKTLRDAGIAPKQLSAASFGEYKPAADNASEEERAKNRRIEIVIVPDLSKLPGYDELNALAGS